APDLYLNRAEATMHFGDFGFGSLRIGKTTYEHDLIIDRGKIRKRKKKPSKKFREGIWAHTSVRRRRDPVEMPAARDRNWGVRPVAGDGGSKTRGRTPQDSVAHRPDQQSHPAHREGSCGKRDPPRDLLGRSF